LKKDKILISDFPKKYYQLPDDPDVIEWVVNAPLRGYEYVKINEATNACELKESSDLKQECYQKFLNSENAKIQQ
jgi:hypothetical protein